MSSNPKFNDAVREAIIQRPDVILDDDDVMNALIAANDRAMGSNIVDLRGIAMERLEHRLDRLEDTHRSVIAAAYDNLAGTNQVHRAVLRMLDPVAFEPFLRNLGGEVAEILRVDAVRLILETEQPEEPGDAEHLKGIMTTARPGDVDAYIAQGRLHQSPQTVTLRDMQHGSGPVYGDDAQDIRSEACLRLDLGENRLPGLLVLGSRDPNMFSPRHGTDLLAFFAGVLERSLRRWLS